jgi:hypothetical protein
MTFLESGNICDFPESVIFTVTDIFINTRIQHHSIFGSPRVLQLLHGAGLNSVFALPLLSSGTLFHHLTFLEKCSCTLPL